MNPNMMSESTKIVPRSMTLGLGFSSPGAPCEFGRAMPAAGAAKKTLHSRGNLLHLSIHQWGTSRTPSVHPQGRLIRTFGGSRGLLARVRKTTHWVSGSPRGKRDNPAGMQRHLDPRKYFLNHPDPGARLRVWARAWSALRVCCALISSLSPHPPLPLLLSLY